MKYLKILNKIIIFLLYFFVSIGLIYSIYYINSEDPYKKHVRRNIKSIFKNGYNIHKHGFHIITWKSIIGMKI